MKPLVLIGVSVLAALTAACEDQGEPGGSAPSATAESQGSAAPEGGLTPAPGALTVADAQKETKEAPDKYRDKQVKVTGVVSKIGKQTAGKNAVTHYVVLTGSKDEKKPRLTCDTHKDEPSVEMGDVVTVEGKGEIQAFASKDGSRTHSLILRDCKITK